MGVSVKTVNEFDRFFICFTVDCILQKLPSHHTFSSYL
jgi:hypothetical protein